MLKLLKKLFGIESEPAPPDAPQFTQEEHEAHYELKKSGLEAVLGPMHDMVSHAIIPFGIGGAVDMYCFPQRDGGTAFATMELIEPDGSGPLPNDMGTYELVAFSRYAFDSSDDPDKPSSFSKAERRLCGIFTAIGHYSSAARLKPLDTCEIPMDDGPNTCLVFGDGGALDIGASRHGLLLCIEVFRSEMEFARENGTEALFERLRTAGMYPRSDMDRDPVVPQPVVH